MALSRAYSEAAVDVLDILNHMTWEDFCRVPTNFIEFLEENSAQDYESNIDYSKEITEMNLTNEAIGILGVMYKQFWASDEKKKIFEEKITEHEIAFENELKKENTNEEIFDKTAIIIDDEGRAMQNNMQLVVVDRAETIFDKIGKAIKNFFKNLIFEKKKDE